MHSLTDLKIIHLCSRYWLFGEKIQHDGITKRERGWFPRTCAIELTEETSYNEQDKNKWINIGNESRYEYREELSLKLGWLVEVMFCLCT